MANFHFEEKTNIFHHDKPTIRELHIENCCFCRACCKRWFDVTLAGENVLLDNSAIQNPDLLQVIKELIITTNIYIMYSLADSNSLKPLGDFFSASSELKQCKLFTAKLGTEFIGVAHHRALEFHPPSYFELSAGKQVLILKIRKINGKIISTNGTAIVVGHNGFSIDEKNFIAQRVIEIHNTQTVCLFEDSEPQKS